MISTTLYFLLAVFFQILSIEGEEVFKADIMVYNIATAGENYSNMSAVDTSVHFQSGVMKVVFLNKFVMDLLVRTLSSM